MTTTPGQRVDRGETLGACDRCGQVHARCTSHNRKGGPCGQPRQPGAFVCHLHGGKSPRARQAAKRRQLEAQAAAAAARTFTDRVVVDPLAELLTLAGEVVAFKDYLRGQVDGLEGVLTYWTDREFRDSEGEPIRTESVENVRAVLAAYERALDRSAKVLGLIGRLGIEDRLARLRETQVAAIVLAVRDALEAGQLDGTVRRSVEGRLASNLRALTAPEQVPGQVAG